MYNFTNTNAEHNKLPNKVAARSDNWTRGGLAVAGSRATNWTKHQLETRIVCSSSTQTSQSLFLRQIKLSVN